MTQTTNVKQCLHEKACLHLDSCWIYEILGYTYTVLATIPIGTSQESPGYVKNEILEQVTHFVSEH